MSEIELVSFIPQTASYQIFYPKHFEIVEDDDGVVSITSPITYSNLTLSGYQVNQEVTFDILLKFLQDGTEDYTPVSEITIEQIADKLLLEGKYKKDSTWWIWWAVAKSNQIILVSVNSEQELSDDDYNLYKFMIAKMEVYPE